MRGSGEREGKVRGHGRAGRRGRGEGTIEK